MIVDSICDGGVEMHEQNQFRNQRRNEIGPYEKPRFKLWRGIQSNLQLAPVGLRCILSTASSYWAKSVLVGSHFIAKCTGQFDDRAGGTRK